MADALRVMVDIKMGETFLDQVLQSFHETPPDPPIRLRTQSMVLSFDKGGPP